MAAASVQNGDDPKLKKLLKKLARVEKNGDAVRTAKLQKKIAKYQKKGQTPAGGGEAGDDGAGTDGSNDSGEEGQAQESAKKKEKARKSKRKRDEAEMSSRQTAVMDAVADFKNSDKRARAESTASTSNEQDADAAASSEAAATSPSTSRPQFRRERTGDVTLVLFYQYVEPCWTAAEHEEALQFCADAGKRCGITGRVRVAREGLNSTITGSKDGARAFAEELRRWKPQHFGETDFKFTDSLPNGQAFKELNVFPVSELVGYGLAHDKAPPLTGTGIHLNAQDYHEMMKQPNTVIIDVRNAYESAIGHFAPPSGGAELIDPRMRKSTDFPGWLDSEETKKKLQGKNVMMYCTGGVRCERATALLRQLDVDVKDVYQLKGGIHRYLEEFRDGGFWAGKNYVFDKRFAHGAVEPKQPDGESQGEENGGRPGVLGNCASCDCPWDMYRGKRKCAACGVPLLVCRDCQAGNADKKKRLRCPTCVQDGVLPTKSKDRFKLAAFGDEGTSTWGEEAPKKPQKAAARERKPRTESTSSQVESAPASAFAKSMDNPGKITRLFVGNLSFKIDEAVLKEALPGVTHIKWITDKESSKFYGSSFVEMRNPAAAGRAVAMDGQKLLGRPLKINYAPAREGDRWPPPPHAERPGGEEPAGASGAGGGKPKGSGGAKFPPIRKRPDPDCRKLFVANVSWEAEDEDVNAFFATAGTEIEKVRWLTDKTTGEFRGCGFLEFKSAAEADKAATMHGKELKGRAVKIDWAE